MALRREVHHCVGLFRLEERVHALPVADVQLDEAEIRMLHGALQRGQVSRIGQLVQADDPVFRMGLQHVIDEIGADEPGPAGHDDGHRISSYSMILPSSTARKCSP